MSRLAHPHPIIKIQGYFRTGTNWLTCLLKKNLPDAFISQNIFGNKHEMPIRNRNLWVKQTRKQSRKSRVEITTEETYDLEARLDEVVTITTSKHPLAWASSFAKFKPLFRRHRLYHYIHASNQCHAAWLAKAVPERSLFVRYFDVLSDPENMIRTLAKKIDGRDLNEFVPLTRTVDHRGRIAQADFDRHEHYLKALYVDELDPVIADAVRAKMDWDVFAQYGYTVDPPTLA